MSYTHLPAVMTEAHLNDNQYADRYQLSSTLFLELTNSKITFIRTTLTKPKFFTINNTSSVRRIIQILEFYEATKNNGSSKQENSNQTTYSKAS